MCRKTRRPTLLDPRIHLHFCSRRWPWRHREHICRCGLTWNK